MKLLAKQIEQSYPRIHGKFMLDVVDRQGTPYVVETGGGALSFDDLYPRHDSGCDRGCADKFPSRQVVCRLFWFHNFPRFR